MKLALTRRKGGRSVFVERRDSALFLFISFPDFVQAMTPWWNAGSHIHVHSNGNAGNQATIDALAELQAEKPRLRLGSMTGSAA